MNITSVKKAAGLSALLVALLSLAACDSGVDIAADKPGSLEAKGRAIADTCLGCHNIPTYTNTYPTFNVPKVWGQHAGYLEDALGLYAEGKRQHATMHAQANTLDDDKRKAVAAFFSKHGEAVTAAQAASVYQAEADIKKAIKDANSELGKAAAMWADNSAKRLQLWKDYADATTKAAKKTILHDLEKLPKSTLSGAELYVVADCASCHGPGGLSQFMGQKLGNTTEINAAKATSSVNPVLAGQYKSFIVHALSTYRDDPTIGGDGIRKNVSMRSNASKLSMDEIKKVAAYLQSVQVGLSAQGQ